MGDGGDGLLTSVSKVAYLDVAGYAAINNLLHRFQETLMKKFLLSFAAVAAGFAAQQATSAPLPLASHDGADEKSSSLTTVDGNRIVPIAQKNGELHNFVLQRATDTSELMAYHSSHRSHSSHSSHSSHYSSRY